MSNKDTRTYLTGAFDQLWAAADRSDAAGVAAVIDAMAADGFPEMADAVRITLFLHGHGAWTTAGFVEVSDLASHSDGDRITITGPVLDWVPMRSNLGRPWVVLVLAGAAHPQATRVEVPPATYHLFGHMIARGEPVTVTGRVDRRGDRPRIVAQWIDEVANPAGS